ncbi:MAG TPA: SDR family oxidoreductase [Candidatus Nitrosopolaris sp.]|nr:SDR family oxidoreductase [Candidatus Nitrosopolaris sp.]
MTGSANLQARGQGPVGIITGAASGIGAATALAFARLGARMVLAGLSIEDLGALVKTISNAGGAAIPIACDVRDPDQVAELPRLAVENFGRIDFLVASAGIAAQDQAVSGDVKRWRDVIETNLLGLAYSVRYVLPQMYQQGSGHIFLIASQSGRHAYQGESIYIASKWGVVGFGHAVRMEAQSAGIKVTLIEPGLVDTPLTRLSPVVRPLLDAFEPLTADDVANAVIYAFTQPPHVTVNELAVRPLRQGDDPFKKKPAGRRARHPSRPADR